MKLASFARVSYLVQERQRLIDHMDHEFTIRFQCSAWEGLTDQDISNAVGPVVRSAINAELRRRIDVVEKELLELGMSIG